MKYRYGIDPDDQCDMMRFGFKTKNHEIARQHFLLRNNIAMLSDDIHEHPSPRYWRITPDILNLEPALTSRTDDRAGALAPRARHTALMMERRS